MPFLLPAVTAACCDFFILYLSQYSAIQGSTGSNALQESLSPTCQFIYQTSYILPAAAFRLFLLFVPLPYYSYHGTALKCSQFYKAFYACILILLLSHIFVFSLCDPSSIGALVPWKAELNVHDATTRHIWSILIFSLIANFCHILLFLHVRSTAPTNAELLRGNPSVLFYYAKEREGTERDSLLNGGSGGNRSRLDSTDSSSTNRMRQISNQLILEVQSRLNKAKDEWTKRINDYHVRTEGNGSQDFLYRPVTPFRVMLQLFAYEDVLTNGRLNSVYEIDNGETLLFFVPQLLSFLLHGAYESSSQLEEWILGICHRNIHFAHRCYWFLRAWSLEAKNNLSRLSRSSSLTSFENLDDALDPDASNKQQPKFLPEERAVIEELLHKVMDCGETPARVLHFGGGDDTDQEQNNNVDRKTSTSPSALMSAVESGAIPIDPKTGMPSANHWECVAAERKFGFMPLSQSLTAARQRNRMDVSYFDATPVFLDALLTIADSLFRVAREQRPFEFRRQLMRLELEALPSNSIYIPLQNVKHRVWRIVADESIAINTNERVPCIICLEVVEYADTNDALQMEPQLAIPDLTGSLSEKDLINRWRYGFRDPHRRDTAFKKLAYQMRSGMERIHLDQVANNMKAQFEKLKDTKPNFHDFLTLPVPDALDDDEEEEFHSDITSQLHTMTPMPTDIERGDEHDSPVSPIPERPVSLDSPTTPRQSRKTPMGQWTSPSKNEREVKDAFPKDLNGLSYQQADIASSSLRSDSGHSNSKAVKETIGGVYNVEVQNQRNEKAAKPTVVFKENWHDKESRIRAGSAFGSNPRWRLLPLLVKANDDLRQEQLASQIIYKISAILAREHVPVWLCPYEILALTESGGIIEAIPDTISIASLKKNDKNFASLKGFFHSYFDNPDQLADAQANFCESLAAYSIVCFLLQIKDRHNGNILLDNKGHLIHIDFGFFFLSSPGKNTGFESAPFKLTQELVDVLDGPDSRLFHIFRILCYRSFIALRRHCMEIILLVEMLKKGNENLPCFRGRPDDAIRELRHRFRLDLNDRACLEYVNSLIDESLENWRTNWYDRYQRYCVGVL